MYVTDFLIGILIIFNFISGAAYFLTRDNNRWWDIPVWSSIYAAGSALLICTAILGEFTKSTSDTSIVFLGMGLFFGLDLIVMALYSAAEIVGTLYDKVVGRALT